MLKNKSINEYIYIYAEDIFYGDGRIFVFMRYRRMYKVLIFI